MKYTRKVSCWIEKSARVAQFVYTQAKDTCSQSRTISLCACSLLLTCSYYVQWMRTPHVFVLINALSSSFVDNLTRNIVNLLICTCFSPFHKHKRQRFSTKFCSFPVKRESLNSPESRFLPSPSWPLS